VSYPTVPAAAKLPRPAGTPTVGEIPQVSQVSPLELEWAANSGSGTVTSVTAADTSIVVTGTDTVDPAIKTAALDVIATVHPPAAAWSNNSKKITAVANGSGAQDAAAFGQTPAGGATVTIAQGGTGQVTATPAFNALNPNAAPAGFLPSNPSGTVSTTQVMMGVGATCSYTPASSGKVLVSVTCLFYTLTGATSIVLTGQYGTGSAPANGAALTGTLFGGNAAYDFAAAEFASSSRQGAFTALLSLTAGTAYWFDMALATTNASDQAVIQNVSMTVIELPLG
jgi:hypothetical protein